MKMYKENFGFNKFNKKMMLSIFSIYIFFFIAFLTVGFSAFETELVMKDVEVQVKFTDADAVISNFKSTPFGSGGIASNTDYNYNRIYGDIILPDETSSVTYEVQVTNLGGAKIGIYDLTGLNENLDYELSGYDLQDVLKDENGEYKLGTTITFHITIKYAENATVTNESQPFNMLVDFRPFYSVTYHGVPGEELFPAEIMEGTDLVINTELVAINRMKITQDTVFLTYGEHYFYNETEKVLTVVNVEGDLLLSYRNITYLANLSSPTAFFKEDAYKTKIKNIYFENHINIPNDDTLVKTYDLAQNGDGSITGWLVDNKDGTYDLYIGSVYDIYTKNFENAFSYMTGLRGISFKNLNTSESISFSYTFYKTLIETLDLSTFNTASAESMIDMFGDMTELESLDVSNFNTENVTKMWYMFGGLSKITELDISTFDTSKVENMGYMFSGMSNLETLKLGPNFNTANVTTMEYMFNGLSKLKSIDLSTFKTSDKLLNTEYMFYNCDTITSLDLSKFNTTSVTSMSHMFYGMDNLATLDITTFKTANVKKMDYMFSACAKLTTLDLNHFETPLVNTMEGMFSSMTGLTHLYLKQFTLPSVYNMTSFAQYCIKLKYIDFRSAEYHTGITTATTLFTSVPSTVTMVVSNEETQAWLQGRIGANKGTFILAKDLVE